MSVQVAQHGVQILAMPDPFVGVAQHGVQILGRSLGLQDFRSVPVRLQRQGVWFPPAPVVIAPDGAEWVVELDANGAGTFRRLSDDETVPLGGAVDQNAPLDYLTFRSPDGSPWQMSVDNTGAVIASPA